MKRGLLIASVWVALGCHRSIGPGGDGGDPRAPDAVVDGGRADAALPDASAVDAGPCEPALEIGLIPTARAQIAVWLEALAARFETVALTAAVARHGLGNRPGAQQMNTGYRWPMGRRLDVLPRWAHRRLERGGAPFRTVVWSDGREGHAAEYPPVGWSDTHYCMSFAADDIDDLDAVTCASPWSGEPGCYLTEADVAAGYAEPFVSTSGEGTVRPLSLASPYPPRTDLPILEEAHPDAARFAGDARAAMPRLDAVTMATPRADHAVSWVHPVPAGWPVDEVEVWVEIHVERDFADAFPEAATPSEPEGAWDHWARTYGIPRGGQPSVVFRARPGPVGEARVREPAGRTVVYGGDGALVPPDDLVDDPASRPGSGVDRLRLVDGARLTVRRRCTP
ncbi:MAG TPA: hypothetical protein RMH99_21630 [Sandaracinaceae bacterium LLY-WYZ-13_1]|nr:hypothetical protein [Sandaracinaceae bacterium LLY-WYZ-13_1]